MILLAKSIIKFEEESSTEGVVGSCSVKKVLLEISQNS